MTGKLSRALLHALPALVCAVTCNAERPMVEPTHEELFALLQQWKPGPRAIDVTAYATTPEIQTARGTLLRNCDLLPYLELVDFAVVTREVSAGSVQYDLALAFQWTLSLKEIKKKDRCIAGQFELVGKPVKGRAGGDPYFRSPIRFVLVRRGTHWLLAQ